MDNKIYAVSRPDNNVTIAFEYNVGTKWYHKLANSLAWQSWDASKRYKGKFDEKIYGWEIELLREEIENEREAETIVRLNHFK